MNNEANFNNKRIVELIEQSKKIAIIPSKIAGADAFCAGVGMFYMLKEHLKDVHFIYPGRIPDNTEDLIDDNDITSDVKQSNLTIRIDYSGTEASQVHYATQDDVLTLTVGPIPNDFNKNDRITTSISSHEFDLMFIIGAQEKRDLGGTAKVLEKQMDYAKLINIDVTNKNTKFGAINIIDINVNSLSMLVFKHMSDWKLLPDEKSAKALLAGIISKENS